jgi:integrase
MLPKTDVLRKLETSLRLLGRDRNTVDAYRRVAARYLDFRHNSSANWSHEHCVEEYLSRRVTRDDVSASTQNHDLAAILALYAAFGRSLGNIDALRAKRPKYARHCPTTAELLALLGELHDTPQVPARLVALWLAACGLRVNEGLSARLKDFRREGDRLQFVVRDPKQAHDRWVPVPALLWPALRSQAAYARRVFEQDQARSEPLPLQVPNALARKYPRAPHSIGWMFLFPSPNPMRHPDTGRLVRWHLPDYDVQHSFARACDRLESQGRIFARMTPHHLRHWYGTHYDGDLRDLQELMGHRSIETTALYRHPQLERATSPLESIAPALALAG